MRIKCSGLKLLVPEHNLNHPDVDALVQQVCRKAVPQAVEGCGFIDSGNGRGGVKDPIELTS